MVDLKYIYILSCYTCLKNNPGDKVLLFNLDFNSSLVGVYNSLIFDQINQNRSAKCFEPRTCTKTTNVF